MKYFITIIAFIFIFTSSTYAQERFKPFEWADGVYWGGMGADLVSSIGKRELSPVLRNSTGHFSPAKKFAFSAGVWSAFKLTEYFYTKPKERRIIRWFKVGVGVAWGVVAIRNLSR